MERIPRWMGIAYRDYDIDCTITYLLPFNWIVRWYRNALYKLRFPSSEAWFEKQIEARANKIFSYYIRDEYNNGYRQGYDEGLLIYADLMHRATRSETKTPLNDSSTEGQATNPV